MEWSLQAQGKAGCRKWISYFTIEKVMRDAFCHLIAMFSFVAIYEF